MKFKFSLLILTILISGTIFGSQASAFEIDSKFNTASDDFTLVQNFNKEITITPAEFEKIKAELAPTKYPIIDQNGKHYIQFGSNAGQTPFVRNILGIDTNNAELANWLQNDASVTFAVYKVPKNKPANENLYVGEAGEKITNLDDLSLETTDKILIQAIFEIKAGTNQALLAKLNVNNADIFNQTSAEDFPHKISQYGEQNAVYPGAPRDMLVITAGVSATIDKPEPPKPEEPKPAEENKPKEMREDKKPLTKAPNTGSKKIDFSPIAGILTTATTLYFAGRKFLK